MKRATTTLLDSRYATQRLAKQTPANVYTNRSEREDNRLRGFAMCVGRVLMGAAIAALSGCASLQGAGSAGSLPIEQAAARATFPKGTLFVAIFAGSLPGQVVFSTPPYKKQGATGPIKGPARVALTKDGSLIVASISTTAAPLSIIKPPYTGTPTQIAAYFWAGGMSMDANDNIFLAEGKAPQSSFNYIAEYLAPGYAKSVQFGGAHGRYITAMTTLPNGALAVGSVRPGPKNSTTPGNLAIFASASHHRTNIAALKYISAMALVPQGLIVVECPECYEVKDPDTYIALVAPPYTKVTKVLAKLPNVQAEAMTSSATGDIFVKQDTVLYYYTPPYSKGLQLAKTAGVLESMIVAPNGNLFYGSTTGTGPQGQFAINQLPAPYTAQPQTIFSAFGPPGGMAILSP
jgi:hypothetical protein